MILIYDSSDVHGDDQDDANVHRQKDFVEHQDSSLLVGTRTLVILEPWNSVGDHSGQERQYDNMEYQRKVLRHGHKPMSEALNIRGSVGVAHRRHDPQHHGNYAVEAKNSLVFVQVFVTLIVIHGGRVRRGAFLVIRKDTRREFPAQKC